jgi:hypothetical protein
MKHLLPKWTALGALFALVPAIGAGVATPQPANACSCMAPQLDFELVDVVLLNPGDLDALTVEEMEAEESTAWPQDAWYSEYGQFRGHLEDEMLSIVIEVE